MIEEHNTSGYSNSDLNIQADIESVNLIPMVSTLLEVVCRTTGMGFAAIARVTEDKWVACSVRDEISFGLKPGGELKLETTICNEIRQSHEAVIIDHVSEDEDFKNHHTPAMYGFQSYISMPIFLKDGSFFGTLCAIDPNPAILNTPAILGMFKLFTDLISLHLGTMDKLAVTESNLIEEKKAAKLQESYNLELAEANQKLAEVNDKLQQAIDTGKMGTWSIDPATYRVTMSDYIKTLFGFPLTGEISVGEIVKAIDPEYQQTLTDILKDAIQNHKNSDIEYPITNLLTKERKWVRATGKLFFNANGGITEYSGMLMDITDRKADEDKQAMLAAIIESSEDAIISKTLDGIITSWNQSAEKLFGHTEAEIIGKHISVIIPESRLEEESIIISKVKQSERIEHFETERKTKSNREIPISLTVSPIRNEQGKVIGASKIARDISKQKEAETQLQSYAERLEILNSIGKTISADLDMQGVLQKVTDATTLLTGASFGAFFHNLVNEKGESYMLYTLSGAPREAFEKFGMPRNTEVFKPTFNGEGIVRVDDITKDP